MIASTYQAVSGSGLAGVQELFEQARAVVDDSEAAGARRRRAAVPARRTSTSRRSRSTWSRWPDRSSTTTPARPTRTRSCATRAARSSASRTCWSAAPVCGCRCTPDTRCRSTPSSPSRCRRSVRANCSPVRAGVKLVDVPTPLAAAGVDESLVGRIRQDPRRARRSRACLVRVRRQPAKRCCAEHDSDRRAAGRRALTPLRRNRTFGRKSASSSRHCVDLGVDRV